MDRTRLKGIFAEAALSPHGWIRNTSILFTPDGDISRIASGRIDPSLPTAGGPVVPGMINLHSHAFQRGMAGRTHSFASSDDDFWSWRASMYEFVERLGPVDLESLATRLYTDMLVSGYTSVCEFHYVHRDTQGIQYADPAEMSRAIIRASRASGIGLTLLPVLYQYGGFGRKEISRGQKRFYHSTGDYLKLIEALLPESKQKDGIVLGYAPHSLRAVDPDALRELSDHRNTRDSASPFHIHVAEQTGEVDDCLIWCAKRPVEWLIDNAPVDANWCLVHSTHVTGDEIRAITGSEAVVGLCPTTEADLGDGIFPFKEFISGGGVYGIGSDSNVSISPGEEIRLIEYLQRVSGMTRNIARRPSDLGAGTLRYLEALEGGRRASGRDTGRLESGSRADFVVLDGAHELLIGKSADEGFNAHLFSGGVDTIGSVIVGGRIVQAC